MITAGVTALASLSPALDDPDESLLPHLQDLRHVSVKVAAAVANAALEEGVATVTRDTPWTEEELRLLQWDPGTSFFLVLFAVFSPATNLTSLVVQSIEPSS
jgi:malate dehydrogenase (oxaloacetate-decarboxylating)